MRYRRGELSPEGYYRDGHDHEAIRAAAARAESDVVVVDGVFLRRPELDGSWDLRIVLEVDEEVALERALERDAERFGGRENTRARYLARYIPARELYQREAAPADLVVENTDPARPRLVR